MAVKITKTKSGMDIKLTVPDGSETVVFIPVKEKTIMINGEKVKSNEKKEGYKRYRLKDGNYDIEAK